jgi:translocation and assembly module TamB
MGWLHRLRKMAPWLAGTLGVITLALLVLMRTAPGHRAVEWLVARATGDTVRVTGLGGALPNHLKAARIELWDENGAWLRAQNIVLEWSAISAIFNHVSVRRVSASDVAVLRQPLSDGSQTQTPRIDIDRLEFPRVALAAPIAGRPAQLSAQGRLAYVSRHDLSADLSITRAGSSDRYGIRGSITGDVAQGEATVSEGDDGILGALISLPGLRPVNLRAVASGDRRANTVTVTLSAGALQAEGQGLLALSDRRADLAFAVKAPAMQLKPGLGWESLAAQVRFNGGFDAPDIDGRFNLAGFVAEGLSVADVTAQAQGQGGALNMTARIAGLDLAGASGLLAQQAVDVQLRADLAAPSRPVEFSVIHPVASLRGKATTRDTLVLDGALHVPSLVPFRALTGQALSGSANLSVQASAGAAQTSMSLKGAINTQGDSLAASLLGSAVLSGEAVLDRTGISRSRLAVDGAAIGMRLSGAFRESRLNYNVSLEVKDFSRLSRVMTGRADISGRITGPVTHADLEASGTADVARKGGPRQRISLRMHAKDLPQLTSASVKADGRLDGARLALDAVLTGKDGRRAAHIEGDWKSVRLRGDLVLPGGASPTGRGTLDIGALADIAPFTGTRAEGKVYLAAQLVAPGGASRLILDGRAEALSQAGAQVEMMTVEGVVTDPFADPGLDIRYKASGLLAQGWSGNSEGRLQGKLKSLEIDLQSRLTDPQGIPAAFAARAVVNSAGQTATLQQLTAQWRDQDITLAAPAIVTYANAITISDMRLGLAGGSIALSGQIAPALALTARAQGIRAEIISLFLPQVSLSGTLSATADLRGALAAPAGTVSLQARNLRNRVYGVSANTAMDVDGHATLDGSKADVEARLSAGKNGLLALTGTAPLTAAGLLDLRLKGQADLALLDPVLAPGGQRMSGVMQIDALVSGRMADPRVRGSATLSNGEFQDFSRGLRLRTIEASLKAGTEGIHLVNLSASAGPGKVTGRGTIDIWSPGWPVDLAFQADNARPIASDLLTASLSGSARLSGRLSQDMTLKGSFNISRAEVLLPQTFPPEVRTLNVRRRGQAPAPATGGGSSLALALQINTTGPVTLRGRGIDADLGGSLDISGSALAPRIGGGFQMRRGTFTIAGQTLDFTTGRVTFDGTGLRGRIDPALDFVASETSGGVTATVAVGGYASRPQIALSSTPALPQDEILARLLFQQSAKQLTPLQLAQGAQALAAIAGLDSGFSPLSWLRGGLGLDRISVGSAAGPTEGTTVEAGKYVSRNVYVGARQGVSGGTQAQVQVDLTRGLKAQATVTTGANAQATKGAKDRGNSIGLSYQFDY